MKKTIFVITICICLLGIKNSFAQWAYVNSIENSLDKTFGNYEVWLKNNGYSPTDKYDQIALQKATTMGSIYNIRLISKVYESKKQPTKIHCYIDQQNILKSLDVFLINPEKGEFENVQLVLLKSGFQLTSESRNENDKISRTYFQKKNIRLNLASPDDKSYLTITASTLN